MAALNVGVQCNYRRT